jgi:hypothetical protein
MKVNLEFVMRSVPCSVCASAKGEWCRFDLFGPPTEGLIHSQRLQALKGIV